MSAIRVRDFRPKGDIFSVYVCRYNIMSRCWHENPQSRLSFSQLIFQLDTEIKLLAPDYTDFDSKSITSETFTPELIL